MAYKFNGKTVVITGASSGIGRALAYEFAALGCNVVLGARQRDKLEEICADINSQNVNVVPEPTMITHDKNVSSVETCLGAHDGNLSHAETGATSRKGISSVGATLCGGRAIAVAADVTHEEDCKRLIETAVKEFGSIDILICNAGISMRALFDNASTDVLHRLMDVNFWGCVYCTKYALPYIQASHGSIVGVSSVAGLHGLPGRTGYSASKYAMTGFLDTIRVENLKKGMHVMVACPGFTSTNVRFSALTADGSPQGETPRKEEKMMTAEEVARRIAHGIRRRKRLLLMEFEGRATHFLKKISTPLLDRMFYNAMAKEPDSPLK